MKAAAIAAVLLLGVALAAPEVTQLFHEDGGVIEDQLSVRTSSGKSEDCWVSGCLYDKSTFKAGCAKRIDNVIVMCEEGTAWKYSGIPGNYFKTTVKDCTIKKLYVKCGSYVNSECPKHWECGKCVKDLAKCSDPTPTPTPEPKDDCMDKSSKCPYYAKCGRCKYSHYANKCPLSCGKCTPKCKDFDSIKCKIIADAGYCEKGHVAKYCPVSCDVCDEETPTPTPTPTLTPTRSPTASPGATTTPSPTATECPGIRTEICWIADLKTSRGAEGWEQIQNFISKSIYAMYTLFPEPDFVVDLGVRAGTDSFETATSTEVGQEIIDFFNDFTPVEGEGSQIELALKRCRQLMVELDRKKVVILITDGNGEELTGEELQFHQLEKQADMLKEDEGAEIFAVAIGAEGNENRLRKLSGKAGSDVEHLHKIDKYVTDKSFVNYAKKILACI